MSLRFNWYGAAVLAALEPAARKSVKEGAEELLAKANEHVPYMTGALESTGMVSVEGTEAAISYDTVYAARLHQHPEYNFQGKGRGRWLAEVVEASEHEALLASMAGPIRKIF